MLSRVVRQILQATVYDVAIETPLEAAPRISQKINNNIRFKREDLQPVFSFKLRGAYNRISQFQKINSNVVLFAHLQVTMLKVLHCLEKIRHSCDYCHAKYDT
jgi:threonine dehydratase